MQTNKIEVSKGGMGKAMFIPLSVFRNRKRLTISYPGNAEDRFKRATSQKGLQQFADKLQELFESYVRA